MSNIYINFGNGTSTGYYAVPLFAINTAYVSTSNGGRGDYVRQLATPALTLERVFRCTTSGTSAATEPAWTMTKNGTTTSGTAVFTECTGQEADQVSGTWKAPHALLQNAMTATWGVAGDTFFVGDNHAQTQGSALTLASPGTAAAPCGIYCVNATGSVPPVSADLRTTATITTTGAFGINTSGHLRMNGITLSAGTGASGAAINLCSGGGNQFYRNCAMRHGTTNAGGNLLVIGNFSSSAARIEWNNTTYQPNGVDAAINVPAASFIWRNTSAAIAGSFALTPLFVDTQARLGNALLEGIDLSAFGSGKTIVAAQGGPTKFIIKDCKIGSGVTVAATPTFPGAEIHILRSDSSGTNYRSDKYSYQGTQVVETTIVRTGGASDGTTGISWNITTNANNKWLMPYEANPSVLWNGVIGNDVTITLEGVWNAAALPNNDDIWFDAEYLGSFGSPLGSFKTCGKTDGLATGAALTASTQAWDSGVTARANATTYAIGNARKVASNPGRVWFCTTAGTSASSEPAGYASGVDGGSVTDGSAVFRAAVRFSMSAVLTSPTPAQAGPVTVYLKAGKASATFFVDPAPTLS